MTFYISYASAQAARKALEAGKGERRAFPASFFQPSLIHLHDEELFKHGDVAQNIYKVESGCIRAYRLLNDGRRQIFSFHLPGDYFGFEPDGFYSYFADAVGKTNVSAIRITGEADLAADLFPLALRSLSRKRDYALLLSRQNAAERVASFLLDMSARQNNRDDLVLAMSRADIGDHLGLTIETVSRIFSKLRSKGIVSFTGLRDMRLQKRRELQHLAEFGWPKDRELSSTVSKKEST